MALPLHDKSSGEDEPARKPHSVEEEYEYRLPVGWTIDDFLSLPRREWTL